MNQSITKIKEQFVWVNNASVGVRKHLVAGTVLGVTRVFLDLAFVLQSKLMIDIATNVAIGSLWKEACILVAIIVIGLILSIINAYLFTQAENLMKNGLREKLFSHLLIAPLYKRGSYHSGDLTARLEEDVSVVTSNIVVSIPSVIITGMQFIGAFWLLMKFDSHLAWIVVLILPFFMIIGKLLSVKLRKMTKDIRNDEGKVQSKIIEGLQHGSLLRSLEAEKLVKRNFQLLQNQLYGKILKRTRFTLMSKSMLSVGFIAGYLVAFLWGCINLHTGVISFGIMTAFLQLVGKIQGPTASLAQFAVGFIHATTSVDRIIEVEQFETEKETARTLLKGVPGIRFENVKYTYPGEDHPIFKSFNYNFYPGSHTAIIGPTGMGKTTLIRLVLSLINPDEGKVLMYDDEQAQMVSPGTRCNISYVPQGNTLLSGTIKENLLIANPHATNEDINKALHIAVADFVFDFPDRLNTMCGEHGLGLSEGQAQRIAIARGLLKPASVLLLDEISASLDKKTEALLFERLNENTFNKTLILITHRTDMSVYCSQILQL